MYYELEVEYLTEEYDDVYIIKRFDSLDDAMSEGWKWNEKKGNVTITWDDPDYDGVSHMMVLVSNKWIHDVY